MALITAAASPAQAACTQVTGTFNNAVTIEGICITNQTFTGNVTNSGTITPLGVVVTNSTVTGFFLDSGPTLTGGISIDATSRFSVADNVISVTGAIFDGGISNAGTITSTSMNGLGIAVDGVSSFSGGVVNSGSITSTVGGGIGVSNVQSFLNGISNTNGGSITSGSTGIFVSGVASFAGGVTNSGAITAGSGAGISVSGVSNFSGGVFNSGSITAMNGAGIGIGTLCGCGIVSTFAGGVTNTGTITAAIGIAVSGVETFSNGIVNNTSINAAILGIGVLGVSSFGGGIVNGGTISNSLGGNGISVGIVETFSGGITNNGAITSTGTGLSTGIGVTAVSSFDGGIVNKGSITASAPSSNGITVIDVSQFSGGVLNSGTISVAGIGIALGSNCGCAFGSTFSGGVTNSGTINANVGIFVGYGETFLGGITNAAGGTITMTGGGGPFLPTGIAVTNVSSFGGGITNNGSITSSAPSSNGISVFHVSQFTGGISNSGTISVAGVGIGLGSACGCSFGSTFSGGITNTGTIVANVGIFVGTGETFSGAIANSGNITGTGGTAIDVSNAPNAMTINQTAGTITGAIKLSPFADVLNISGGAIAGDILGAGSSNTVNFMLGAGMFSYANAISGVNAVNVNSGTLLLTGTIGPTALTIDGPGTLMVGNGGSIAGNITDNGIFAVQRTDTYTYGGVISGTGAFQQLGTGTTVLTGANSYQGATLVSAGTLQAGAVNTFAPTSAFTVNGGATLDLASFNQTIGSLAGTGNVTLGAATLTTGGNNTSTTFGGVISGTGGVVQSGSGRLTLAGANTYTGGTSILAGALQLGNGGSSGSILGNVLNNGLLAINRSDSYSFDGVISGTGALAQIGTGTTILTGASTYTGPTSVDAGKLVVNGSIVSPVTINAGGTLGGNGTLGPVTVNGGTLSPGNSIGLITVNGNLNFVGAGNYLVELSPTNADRTNVTGAATLSGAVHAQFQPGATFFPRSYTILSAAGGVSGTFGSIDATDAPAFAPALSYTSTDVLLTLQFKIGSVGGLNQSQQAAASAIQAAYDRAGSLPTAFYTLASQPRATLSTALTQVSGELGTGVANAGFRSMDQFLNVMLDPFLETRMPDGSVQGRALGFAPEARAALPDMVAAYAGLPTKAPPANFEQRWTVWGATYGGTGQFAGNAALGTNALGVATGSFAAGIDYRVSPDTVIGVAAAGGVLNYGIDRNLGTGHGDAVQAGLYGSTRFGNAYVSAALAYGRNELTTDRTIAFGGLTDRLAAAFGANSYGGRLESGYRFALDTFGLTPFAAVETQGLQTPAYTERDLTGLAAFALAYNAQTFTDTRSEIGARLDYRLPVDNGTQLTLRARAAWAHDFSINRAIDAAFVVAPGSGFNVAGAAAAPDTALVSAGAEWSWRNGVSLRAKFDGQFGSGTQIYSGMGALRVTW